MNIRETVDNSRNRRNWRSLVEASSSATAWRRRKWKYTSKSTNNYILWVLFRHYDIGITVGVFLVIYFKNMFMYPEMAWHRAFSNKRR